MASGHPEQPPTPEVLEQIIRVFEKGRLFNEAFILVGFPLPIQCRHSVGCRMMIRQRCFRVGQRVKLHDPENYGSGNAYPLPPGWDDGEEVTIIHFDHGWATVLGQGKEAEVFIANIDTGWDEEYAPGKWRERRS